MNASKLFSLYADCAKPADNTRGNKEQTSEPEYCRADVIDINDVAGGVSGGEGSPAFISRGDRA